MAWRETGGLTSEETTTPPTEQLAHELALVRRVGLTRLVSLEVPALTAAATALLGAGGPAEIERLLIRAVESFGEGDYGQAAAFLFGLAPGSRGHRPTDLRERAAYVLEVRPRTFRGRHEQEIIERMAAEIYTLALRGYLMDAAARRNGGDETKEARFERLLAEIESLSALELGELIPLLAERLGVPNEVAWGGGSTRSER